jgi:hypothetical protein
MLASDVRESVVDGVLDPEIVADLDAKRSQIFTRSLSTGGRILTDFDKLYIAMQYVERRNATGVSQNQFAREIGLTQKTLGKYLHALEMYINHDMMILHSREGRPCKLDEEGVAEVLATIKSAWRKQQVTMPCDVDRVIMHSVGATKRRKGVDSFGETVSKTYVRRFKEAHDLVDGKVQLKTDARIEAEADPRNAYSMICLVKAFCEGLDAKLILNWDATQYIVSNELQQSGVYIKAERANYGPLTAPSSGTLDFAIKMYHLHNAEGYSAPPVFVIADDSMNEDAFSVEQVVGLGLSIEMNSYGWVCVTKTRACNPAFYRWFGKEVVCKFVDFSREYASFIDENAPRHAFVSCDGEAKQIEVFQEPEMLASLDASKILLVKTPASCSAICQPSDVSAFFKASKKRLEYLPRASRIEGSKSNNLGMAPSEEEKMETDLRVLYANNRVRARILSALSCTKYASDKKERVIDALQRVAWALRDTLTQSMVIQGYTDIGWGPRPNLAKAMSKCTGDIPTKASKILNDKFDQMATIFRNTGTLTEKDMDDAGIISTNHLSKRTTSKDQRVLHQQRAVLMNSPTCITQYIHYRDAKDSAKAAMEERRKSLNKYKMGLEAYRRWLTTLNPEQHEKESKIFKKGMKRRVNELLTAWEEQGDEECPWLLEPTP